MKCNYCKRAVKNPVVADKQTYCGKLCAAMGLILEVDQADKIQDDLGSLPQAMDNLLSRTYPLPLLLKVRQSDLEGEDNAFDVIDSVPKGYAAHIVEISDSGTPDWAPRRARA